MMHRPDSSGLLPKVEVPTLIVVGDEDLVTPPDVAEEMRALIPRAELAIIPHAGHLSNIEQPERFTDAVARFLAHRL